MFVKRSLSGFDFIFCEIETRFENGTKTKYLPAIDISEVIRGPFA